MSWKILKTIFFICLILCCVILVSGCIETYDDNTLTKSTHKNYSSYTFIRSTPTPTPEPIPTPNPTPFPSKELEKGLQLGKIYHYTLNGEKGTIRHDFYSGVNEYLSLKEELRYTNDYSEYYIKYMNDDIQNKYLSRFLDRIKEFAPKKDDQARIAISIVQNIPYDYEAYNKSHEYNKNKIIYPYRVLFENKGICEGKSLLTAYLLREIGFGVVLFIFEEEQHMTVGIKAPVEYSYNNTGYAFIETTAPTIITDYQADYINIGKLTSEPEIIIISEGLEFSSISEEYKDARIYRGYADSIYVMPTISKNQYYELINKYGLF